MNVKPSVLFYVRVLWQSFYKDSNWSCLSWVVLKRINVINSTTALIDSPMLYRLIKSVPDYSKKDSNGSAPPSTNQERIQTHDPWISPKIIPIDHLSPRLHTYIYLIIILPQINQKRDSDDVRPRFSIQKWKCHRGEPIIYTGSEWRTQYIVYTQGRSGEPSI